jgi:hypothetical protein
MLKITLYKLWVCFLSLYGNVLIVSRLYSWNMEIGGLSEDAQGLVSDFF